MTSDDVRSPAPESTRALTAPSRRAFTAGAVGIGASALLGGCSQVLSDADGDSVDHLVKVSSVRRSEHTVLVRTAFDGAASYYGPQDVGYRDDWDVTEFTEPGELSVTVRVAGDVVWDDTHELPEVTGSRRSFSLVELQPDREVLTRVMAEE